MAKKGWLAMYAGVPTVIAGVVPRVIAGVPRVIAGGPGVCSSDGPTGSDGGTKMWTKMRQRCYARGFAAAVLVSAARATGAAEGPVK